MVRRFNFLRLGAPFRVTSDNPNQFRWQLTVNTHTPLSLSPILFLHSVHTQKGLVRSSPASGRSGAAVSQNATGARERERVE